MKSLLALVLLTFQVVTTIQPPRDKPPQRAGTGVISGVVTAADTGMPMRGAVVMLMPQGGGSPATRRSVAADLNGYFEFTGLPGGTYSLRADPGNARGQYVGAAYGTPTMEAVGKPIVLQDGQRIDTVNIALRRGGAIEGRVLDEFGEPVARVSVYPLRVAAGGAAFMRTGPGAQTDDHGRFRIFGLPPAEYIVAAESHGTGGMGMATEGVTEGFVTTFSTSTLVEREASRVRITPGSEASGVDVQLVRTRTFRISGRAFDSQGQLILRPMIMLVRQQPGGFGSASSGPMQVEPDGRFTFRDVVPGEYRLAIRPGSMGAPPGQQPAQAVRQEFASMPLHVAADIEDVVLVTSPGVSIAGSVVFADRAPLKPPSLRIFTQPADRFMMMGRAPDAPVDADLRFTLADVFGPLRVRLQPLPPGYALESVRVGGKDITDEPFEFRAAHSGQLELVVTNRVGRLEGQVTDDNEAPAGSGLVLVLPEDREKWRIGGSRTRTSAFQEGTFSVNAVLPGRYYVVAVAQELFVPGPDPGPEFFETFVKHATAVVLNEGETRSLDLRLVRAESGR